MNRRRFIASSSTLAAAAAAAVAATRSPFLPHARAQSDDPIQIAFMGLGNRGSKLLREFLATGRVAVTWLCDADQRAIESAARSVQDKQRRPFKTEPDIRRVLEDRRLDAVVIAAPDHWHGPAAILAAQAGKHVYLEAPLTHNPREGEWLIEAARRARVVFQVGLQRRSLPWVQHALIRVRGGALGRVHFVRAWHADQRPSIGFGQLAPAPAGLDYSLWQGPAPQRPFRDNVVVNGNWRWFWHWGLGELGTSGVHYLDLARWGLDAECPSRVSSTGGRYYYTDDQETPDTQAVTYEFADRVLVWEHRSCQPEPVDGEPSGVAFYGRDATLILGDRGFRIIDLKGEVLAAVEGDTPVAPHVANFLDAIRNPGRTASAGVADGHLSALLCHLGNISHRTSSALRVNPTTRQVLGSADAARLWTRDYNSEWRPRV